MDVNHKALIASALAFAIAGAMQAEAQAEQVKCYGVAKAGQNDCGADGHNCHQQATTNYDPKEWKMVGSKEQCEKMGGSLMAGGKHHKMREQSEE
jgi:uncharacterized membrane protein